MTAETMAKRVGPLNLNIQSVERIEVESFSSEVYRLETDERSLILKFPYNAVKFWREKEALSRLTEKAPVPQLINSMPPDAEQNGALLMELMPGQPMAEEQLNTPSCLAAAGEVLGRIHQIEFPQPGTFGAEGVEYYPLKTWWEYRRSLLFESWAPIIQERLGLKIVDQARDFFENTVSGLPPTRCCFAHCDYRPGNILFAGSKLIAVIDFESTRLGDPGYDFIKIQEAMSESPELWKSFLDGYAKHSELPPLEKLIPYYDFDLNFGFVYWGIYRKDEPLMLKRLEKLRGILG